MKKTIFFIFCLGVLVLPAKGFKKIFGTKKTPKPNIFLKDSFLIEKNIVLDGELYALRLGYATAPNLDEILVSAVYDELLQKPITNISWITQDPKSSKKPATNIQAFKTQQSILKQMEEMAQALDPNSAYDRIINDKHLIKKDFFFKKSEIFDMSKTLEEKKQILEINFLSKNSNLKFPLDISQEIYFKQFPAVAPPSKKPKSQSPSQSQKPKPTASTPERNANFGNAKVPSYLYPDRSSPAPDTAAQNRSPSPEEINQMIDLKELEEARMKVQGIDQFYQTQMQSQPQTQETNIPSDLRMMMQESQEGFEDSEELF
jgi:hypothetical protein